MQALGLVWGNLDLVAQNVEEIRTEIPAPTQYGACLLLDQWKTRELRGGFVVGRDVPSRDLASILRNIALYEPIDGSADFRVRLAGTAFMRRFGRDITGLTLSRIYGRRDFEEKREALAGIIRSKKPAIVDVKILRDARTVMRFEGLGLRVFSPDRKDTWVMGGLFYSDWL
ncbi:MAG TPA: PAS domain-containing protein [Rhizomicrobium sp.]|nr:PAS domain-containing protein [Rhizomicrobium sp.]